jgi:hypothetical protein
MVLDEDTLKMANGSSLLFSDDGDVKNCESQITSFLCCRRRALVQMVALACFAYILPFLICNIFRKKNFISGFRISTAMPSSGWSFTRYQ